MRAWEVDPSALVIRALEATGLAWDVNPDPARAPGVPLSSGALVNASSTSALEAERRVVEATERHRGCSWSRS
jgi:hypothetical protein